MIYANVSIHFYLKKDATPSLRGFPVYCRITYQRKKAELFTGEHCFPERWNDAAGAPTRDPRLKEYLSHLEEKLRQSKRQLEMAQPPGRLVRTVDAAVAGIFGDVHL